MHTVLRPFLVEFSAACHCNGLRMIHYFLFCEFLAPKTFLPLYSYLILL